MDDVIITFSKTIPQHNNCAILVDSFGLLEKDNLRISIGDELGIGDIRRFGNGTIVNFTEIYSDFYIELLKIHLNIIIEPDEKSILINCLNTLIENEKCFVVLRKQDNV